MTMNEKKYCVALWQYVTVMTANTTNITKLIDRMAFSPFESVSPAKTFAKTRALSVPAPAPNRAHGCCIWIGTNGSLAQSTGSPAAPGFERAPSQKRAPSSQKTDSLTIALLPQPTVMPAMLPVLYPQSSFASDRPLSKTNCPRSPVAWSNLRGFHVTLSGISS
jgi:hypothetical protein